MYSGSRAARNARRSAAGERGAARRDDVGDQLGLGVGVRPRGRATTALAATPGKRFTDATISAGSIR